MQLINIYNNSSLEKVFANTSEHSLESIMKSAGKKLATLTCDNDLEWLADFNSSLNSYKYGTLIDLQEVKSFKIPAVKIKEQLKDKIQIDSVALAEKISDCKSTQKDILKLFSLLSQNRELYGADYNERVG